VVGRNGSGKSSFAEGLEVLLTGSTHRFDSSSVFKDGWRNRHCRADARVAAELHIAGVPGSTIVQRTWADDAGLDASAAAVHLPTGERTTGLGALGWANHLATYKPFLAHGELEAMFGRPSELYDRLAAVLGLGDLVIVQERLASHRKALEQRTKTATAERKALVSELQAADDTRAAACAALLGPRRPDFDEVQRLVTGATTPDRAAVDTLRRLVDTPSLSPGNVDDTAAALRDAADALDAVAGTEAGRAHSVVGLLEAALRHHDEHPDPADCPVCGRTDALTGAWRDEALSTVATFRAEAGAADAAHDHARRALAAVRQLVRPPALDVAAAEHLGVDLDDLARAWHAIAIPSGLDAGDAGQLRALASALLGAAPEVDAKAAEVRGAAAVQLRSREDLWSPLAERLARWLDGGRAAEAAEPQVKALKSAEAWLKGAHDDIRNERLRPLGERAQAVWQRLRHESNVDLGAIRLSGSSTRRALDIPGAVDGADGQALGVMSQGEVNALALSLFLPRATLPESPFRFVIIDDPVQAMDPSKVEGLAQVLHDTAQTHQVVVFSHDDRLPAAIRQLMIPARIVQVQRRPGSVVEIVPAANPAEQALRDAKGIANDRKVPPEVKLQVVPGLCRLAVEATLTAAAQRRLLRAGIPHAQVDAALQEAQRLRVKAELAFFGAVEDERRIEPVLRDFHGRHSDTFFSLNRGAHGDLIGDPRELVRAASALVDVIEERYP
jgi:energy-coupling factor transporter ATP-binding protein EcfA2